MQTIARANRVYKDKQAGFIIDYINVFRNLKNALAMYAMPSKNGQSDVPVQAKEALVQTLHDFVLELNKRNKDIRKLVNNIENCIMEILREYKVNSYADKKNIGIWVGNKKKSMKIAAIGIRVKKWVAYHGFSLNVSNET